MQTYEIDYQRSGYYTIEEKIDERLDVCVNEEKKLGLSNLDSKLELNWIIMIYTLWTYIYVSKNLEAIQNEISTLSKTGFTKNLR